MIALTSFADCRYMNISPSVKNAVAELGIGRFATHLMRTREQVRKAMLEAIEGRPSVFGAHRSYLTRDLALPTDPASVLVLDIGGTKTSALLAVRSSKGHELAPLFSVSNVELCARGDSLSAAAACMYEMAAHALSERGVNPSQIRALTYVWSNAAKHSEYAKDGIRGIEAVVAGKACNYAKGEPWNSTLADGMSLNDIMLPAARQGGFSQLRTLVAGNDTIFVATNRPGAVAGLVASTGANGTALNDRGEYLNLESGAGYLIERDCYSVGDMLAQEMFSDPKTARSFVSLEGLCGGKWLPRSLECHILALAKAGVPEFIRLSYYVGTIPEGVFFDGPTISSVLGAADSPSIEGKVPAELVPALRYLTEELCASRAGTAAGVLAFTSISNQIGGAGELVLDSSQGERIPGYKTYAKRAFDALCGSEHRFTLNWLPRLSKEVSVPHVGAANAAAALDRKFWA